MTLPGNRVFINVPFDDEYAPLLRALLFAIKGGGFFPCCALDKIGGGETRIDKICGMIEQTPLSIHDLSRAGIDEKTGYPRFNMPFELGISMGYRYLDPAKRDCLIFDKSPHRHHKFISDLAGNNIEAHHNNEKKMIFAVRHFLWQYADLEPMSGEDLYKDYNKFDKKLPSMCKKANLKKEKLDFLMLSKFIQSWWEPTS